MVGYALEIVKNIRENKAVLNAAFALLESDDMAALDSVSYIVNDLLERLDIFSELDSKRKESVTNGIKKCQVIITSCEKEGIENTAGNVIEVKQGSYTRIK